MDHKKRKYLHCQECDMKVGHVFQDGVYVCQNCGHESQADKEDVVTSSQLGFRINDKEDETHVD